MRKVIKTEELVKAVSAAGESGLTVEGLAEKFGVKREVMRSACYRTVKSGLIVRHREEYEMESGRQATRHVYLMPEHYKEEWDEPLSRTARALDRLQHGEVLDIYWEGEGERGYGDHKLHQVCTRLWQQGYDVRKRKNPQSGRWEYRIEN